MNSLKEVLGSLVLIALTILYAAFVNGFVLYKFWYWFVLPPFPAAPALAFGHAVGINTLLGLVRKMKYSVKDEKKTKDEKQDELIIALIAPWILLGVGYFIKLVIG